MRFFLSLSLLLAAGLILSACTTPPVVSTPPVVVTPPLEPRGGLPGGSTSDSDAESAEEGTPSDEDTAPATTADERRGELDKSLDESLGEFDKTLAEEQRRTAAERDARTASTAGSDEASSGAGVGGAREGDLRSERAARSTADAARGEDQRDRGSVGAGSGAPDRSRSAGDDDDIVARRLRRAAEQETDPELREKLWKEYEDYKRNARGGS